MHLALCHLLSLLQVQRCPYQQLRVYWAASGTCSLMIEVVGLSVPGPHTASGWFCGNIFLSIFSQVGFQHCWFCKIFLWFPCSILPPIRMPKTKDSLALFAVLHFVVVPQTWVLGLAYLDYWYILLLFHFNINVILALSPNDIHDWKYEIQNIYITSSTKKKV